MTHQRDFRKAVPEPARRLQGQATEPVALPYHMGIPSRSAIPVCISSPSTASHEGGQIREGTRTSDHTDCVPRPEEVYFLDHDEEAYTLREDSHHSTLFSSTGGSQSAELHALVCACGPKCICKPACKYQIHSCPCSPCLLRPSAGSYENEVPSRSFEIARTDPQYNPTGHARQLGPRDLDKAQPDRSFSDGTMSRQKSQAARVPRRKDVNVGTTGAEPLHPKGQRAPRTNSNLAYVPSAPTKTPSRKPKDTTPLGFYGTHGSHSGHRYPTFTIGPSLSQSGVPTPPVFAAVPRASEQGQTIESIAHTLLQLSSSPSECQIQAFEPMTRTNLSLSSPLTMSDDEEMQPGSRTPSPLSAPRQRRYQCNKTYAAITGEDLKSYSHLDEYQPLTPVDAAEALSGTVTYPAIPRSTSAGLFNQGVFTSAVTQSFPSAQAGNPRGPEGSPDQAGILREDWYGHGNKHTAGGGSGPVRHSSPASSRRNFPPPLPLPLPLPDFIAPRPATKQRYVSAGGTAKLEDRPEITDFTLPDSVTPGISMQRDLLLQRLECAPQFATPTRSASTGSPMPIRGSEEALRDSSTRNSYEDGSDVQDTKRDRKEGGSNQRLARFKRVFSFGKEGKDNDSKGTSPSK